MSSLPKEFKKAAKRILIHHIPLYGNDYENLCSGLWGKLLEKAPFNISLNAHTHEYAYHPKGSLGNNFPVIIGGGYSMKSATVMVIEKKKLTGHPVSFEAPPFATPARKPARHPPSMSDKHWFHRAALPAKAF